jgi:hypothetical protein
MLKAMFCKARGSGLGERGFLVSSLISEMRGNFYIYKKEEEVLRCLELPPTRSNHETTITVALMHF